MRPTLLYNLFANIDKLRGIAQTKAAAYHRLSCYNIRDLLYHRPVGVIDRRYNPSLDSALRTGDVITQVVKVLGYSAPKTRKGPYRVACSNATGTIEVIYFQGRPDYLQKLYPMNAQIVISGRIEKGMHLQMVHPDIVAPASELNKVQIVEPVYPLTYALSNKHVRQSVQEALRHAPNLPEWLQADFMAQHGWRSWKDSLLQLHNPQEASDIGINSPFWQRLAFDEILAQQLSLYAARCRIKKPNKEPLIIAGHLVKALCAILPFALTDSQLAAIAEITTEQKSAKRMLRLLQGDVGSGKTLVAFAAMLNAKEAGKQAALIAPTDILARQHYQNLLPYCEQLGIKIALLTGKLGAKEKRSVLEALASGECDFAVGTHALFQEAVSFARLALVVVDEQHRFGVQQRLALAKKGDGLDVLMMSATPIPRTLAMVTCGDMDIFTMCTKPANRKAVQTSLLAIDRIAEVLEAVKRVLARDEKVFWLCPLVEESEKLNIINVNKRWELIEKVFPGQAAIVHGKMPAAEREQVMQRFAEHGGDVKILVATTVIEVGVDVPDATVMVVENAERFGLSQLHQLRGRVGRSDKQSHCLLLYQQPLGEVTKKRLQVIKNSNDGFYIAEQDLLLRGGGDFLGTRQSGLPDFKIFDAEEQNYLIELANSYLQQLIQIDPQLTMGANQHLRLLMHLFDYEQMLEYFSFS